MDCRSGGWHLRGIARRNGTPISWRDAGDCLSHSMALASDYDSTLAREARVEPAVVDALARFRRSGRQLILVTGRELPDLLRIFPQIELFDRVVAENGALLRRPDGSVEALADPPPAVLIDALRQQGAPVSVGRVIVATNRRHARIAAAAIERHNLNCHIIFNKGAAMVLPRNIHKGTGLLRALDELRISPAETFGIGDAENDNEFLSLCGCAAAVANALPTLKRSMPLVTSGSYGAGVIEAMDRIMAADGRKAPRIRATQPR